MTLDELREALERDGWTATAMHVGCWQMSRGDVVLYTNAATGGVTLYEDEDAEPWGCGDRPDGRREALKRAQKAARAARNHA